MPKSTWKFQNGKVDNNFEFIYIMRIKIFRDKCIYGMGKQWYYLNVYCMLNKERGWICSDELKNTLA